MMKCNLICSLFLILPFLASCTQKQVYIVYFGEHNAKKLALHEIEEFHHSYLLSIKKTEEEARASLLYSYKHSINGFAAELTPDEASTLSELEEVVSVIKSDPNKYTLQTTRSWRFVGLEEEEDKDKDEDRWSLNGETYRNGTKLLKAASYGKNVIVGVLDSGVWPESKSFSEKGMGPVPKSWRGICQTGMGFLSTHCNRKIIGARYYLKGFERYYGRLNTSEDYSSPRDIDGHGTHTASTVAGQSVSDAAAFGGFARGTASGGAPLAHLAIYKVCWAIPNKQHAGGNTCFEEDMLAAMDDAIADGVHVLSISIGYAEPYPYLNDAIAIGALHATKNNIVVSCSAGNSGPTPSTLSNAAPWIITVGASSVDRAFLASLYLGNGKKIIGQSITAYSMESKMHPLVYAGDVVVPGTLKNISSQCAPGSLSPEKVKGKIVICLRGSGTRVEKSLEVKRAGGVGFILGNGPANGAELTLDSYTLPSVAVKAYDSIKIINYIKSTKNPTALITTAKTKLGYKPTPIVASFSSRGPNEIDPNILKPDIIAPGINILAAWSEASSPTKLREDKRRVKYNINSGTSMSAPHVSGAATLMKAIHPNWSSAAIRSALITTASVTNNKNLPITDASTGNYATPFQIGAGHFRPIMATDPGLVYDASYEDYLLYLCSLGYSITQFDREHKCPRVSASTVNLNYPSIAIPNLRRTVYVQRTVTNVGNGNSTYVFSSSPPSGVSLKAFPRILRFRDVGQKLSFTIQVGVRLDMFSGYHGGGYRFGWYTWEDGVHSVRSPVAVSLG